MPFESRWQACGELPRIGTAGWSVPAVHAAHFAEVGTHLARYAARFDAVEINSSFYRPHRPATYARWAASVPAGFRFAVKVPKAVTHEARLAGCADRVARFIGEVEALGDRLGPLLVQLPPSLRFEARVADAFMAGLAGLTAAPIVCEPRHATWFTAAADQVLRDHRVARVAADPAPVTGAGEPGGWPGLAYWRLHGSPRMYSSAYEPAALAGMASRLVASATPAWCIFDNTAAGHALGDAMAVRDVVARGRSGTI